MDSKGAIVWKNLGSLLLLVVAFGVVVPRAYADPNRYFGEYRVVSVTRYGGGLTSESEAYAFVGKMAHIGPDAFSVLDVSVKNPVYRMETIPIGKEGNIVPSDTSIFYGYHADRTEVLRLGVFKQVGGHAEENPYDALEVLGDDTLLEMYDGWFVLLKRQH